MVSITRSIALNKKTRKVTFSKEHLVLIKRAHPFSKGRELKHVCNLYDDLAKEKKLRPRIVAHLQGRAFGFWGECA